MYRLILAVAMILLAGCTKAPPVDHPPIDHMPIVIASLSSGAALAHMGQEQAIAGGDAVACVTTGALEVVAGAAAKVLASGGVLEEVTIDLSLCALLEPPAEGHDLPPVVDASISIAVLAARTVLASYGPTFESQDCDGYQRAVGVVDWVESVKGPILDEITSPDGVLVIPPVDLVVDCD